MFNPHYANLYQTKKGTRCTALEKVTYSIQPADVPVQLFLQYVWLIGTDYTYCIAKQYSISLTREHDVKCFRGIFDLHCVANV